MKYDESIKSIIESQKLTEEEKINKCKKIILNISDFFNKTALSNINLNEISVISDGFDSLWKFNRDCNSKLFEDTSNIVKDVCAKMNSISRFNMNNPGKVNEKIERYLIEIRDLLFQLSKLLSITAASIISYQDLINIHSLS